MLLTRTNPGPYPLSTPAARMFLRQDSPADDPIITALVLAATEYAEAFTGRDLRANTYQLLLDAFEDRIELPRTPVASISAVEYLLANAWTAVSSGGYYLKNGPWSAEVLLKGTAEWPTDVDDVEHGVRVTFVTAACAQTPFLVEGLQRHVAALYQDRGDVGQVASNSGPDGQTRYVVAEMAKLSGAEAIYQTCAIPRF